MVFGYYGNGIGNGMPYPLFINGHDDEYNNTKIAHDMYNVYVNKDYVGKKVLVAQGEKVEDINGYLKNQGFNGFNASLEGDSYSISCRPEESHHMKDALSVYLKIR